MNEDERKNDRSEERLNEVYIEYVRAINAGQDHAKEDLCKQYPDLAPDIVKFNYLPPLPPGAVVWSTSTCPQCNGQLETPLAGGTTCASCGARFQRGSDQADPFPLPYVVGRIEIKEVIGRGSFGTVYRGWDPQMMRVVALKALRKFPDANPNAVNRFLQDGQIEAQLDHPGIVNVYDVGQVQEVPYLISEFIPGGTLANLIRDERGVLRENRPGPKQAALYVAAIADALEHAHQRGVVHRDVKPANILMKYGMTPLLTDFGLAHWDAGEITTTVEGKIIGTLAYMSPEQARGQNHLVDCRSDVYSLGVVLYELLTGERPFRGNVRRMLAQIESDEPRSPRALVDSVPRDLETICLRCLRKDPKKRFKTAADLAGDLRRYLKREPIESRPVGHLERLVSWSRRKPGLAAALGSVAILLIATASIAIAWAIALERYSDNLSVALNESELRRAENHLDRALMHAERGEVGTGLLWLTHSLVSLPAGADDLQWTVRANLSAWRQQHYALTECRTPPGRVLGFGSDDQTVWVSYPDLRTISRWNVTTGQFIGLPLKHPWPVGVLAQSNDGRRVATGSMGKDLAVYLWNVETGVVEKIIQARNKVSGIAYSADEQQILLAECRQIEGSPNEITVRFCNSNTAQQCGQSIVYPGAGAQLSVSPDGRTLVTVDLTEKFVRRWELPGGRPLGKALLHQGFVRTAAFSPNGRTIVTGSEDGAARVWDFTTGRLLGVVHHRKAVTVAAFSRSGQTLRTAGSDDDVHLWQEPAGIVPLWTLVHPDPARALAVSPDGKMVATGCDDDRVRLWEVSAEKPKLLRQFLSQPQHSPVAGISISPDGKHLAASMHLTPQAWLWEWETGRSLLLAHGNQVRQVVFSPNGKFVATIGYDNKAILWDTATGEQAVANAFIHGGNVHGAAFSPDSQMIVTVGSDAVARRWDTETGTPIDPPLQHGMAVRAVAFSPDGRTILTGSDDGAARLWNAANGEAIGNTLDHNQGVWIVGFGANGRLAITGSADQTAKIWEVPTGQRKGVPFWHAGRIRSVSISPDGRWGVTGSADQTARVWDLRTGRALGPPLIHDGEVHTVAIGGDGRWFATAAIDPHVRFWRAPEVPDAAASRLTLWTQVLTGMILDPGGGTKVMDAAAWHERRQMLENEGEPRLP